MAPACTGTWLSSESVSLEAASISALYHLSCARLFPVCLVAAACGLQQPGKIGAGPGSAEQLQSQSWQPRNAMCTSHFGAIVRTTHVTGTVSLSKGA